MKYYKIGSKIVEIVQEDSFIKDTPEEFYLDNSFCEALWTRDVNSEGDRWIRCTTPDALTEECAYKCKKKSEWGEFTCVTKREFIDSQCSDVSGEYIESEIMPRINFK